MDTALLLSGVVGIGIAAQWLAWYLKQPSILFLLLIGIIVGPVLGVFDPDLVLGELMFPFISLGVAIILFEGSLTLEFDEIKQHGTVVQMLVSVGVLITIAIVALSTYLLFDVDPLIALLFGALVCVTGPTVIMPLLRSVRPNKTISNILKWEGIIIDPIGAIAVVLVYEYIISGGEASSILLFAKIVVLATALGMAGAWVLAFLMRRHMIPEFLRNVFTLAFVLVLFSVSNHLEHESGLLTVTVLGVALANWPKFPRETILEFNESLTILLVSVLFIILAARVELESLLSVGFAGLVLLAIVMFVARPLSVWASSIGSNLKTNEKLMISWIGPRGIVAAAISSLFAIRLQEYDIQGVELLVPLVFLVIIGTVMIQGLGAKMVGNFLGVREPETNGILIVGSNPIALLVATSLKEQGFDVIVAHNNYTNIARARMSGLRTYFGNPISDHADHHLDLIGIGRLFAMSMDKEMNTLSEIHYRHEFGERKLYRLKFSDEKVKSERDDKQSNFHSQWLFDDATYTKLASMLSKKARIKITNITDSYSFEQYKADNKQFVPLYTIDKEGKLHVITNKFDGTVPRDRKLISLVVEDEVQPKPVDVTPKQEQARMAADANFESKSKAPDKRKEKELSDDNADVAEQDPATATDKDNNPETDNEQKVSSDSSTSTNDSSSSESAPAKPTTANDKGAESKSESANTADKGVMSANSTAESKTTSKSKLSSSTNGDGNAPKTKKGSLDPNRLPDSGQNNATSTGTDASSDADASKDVVQKDLDKKKTGKE
ncbi:cation:proton antiporter [Psychrobacter sp. FME5]|uniref:cation:proton antiporter n=1 Tax=Psychrobacter sp. FME5 TaxID=2487706 RepID=UPI00178888E1|nr:sodium:proton antiporter [Psychrobacter sp. FME5]MBE0445984.1 sodium:proton antiporter [Psychrobacter sp. FME5]MDN5802851.1 cation:proton antiporter [Psychrobacter sp.]MDN5890751.1 cation:proton antiporter [Psychrobacter sp.]